MKMQVKGNINLALIVSTLILVIVSIAYATKTEAAGSGFIITWEHPKTDIDGNPEDVSRITGYDIWYRLDGADKEYAAWVPMDSSNNVLESTFNATEVGEYCFQLATVTKDDGKSDLSDPVCASIYPDEPTDPVDPDLGKPSAPVKITIIISGSTNVEVEIKDATD